MILGAFIYALQDPSGEVRYIGLTSQDPRARLASHLSRETDTYCARWIRSLRPALPEMIVLHYCESLDIARIFEAELIKAYREAGAHLTNMSEGGELCDERSPEVRAAISKNHWIRTHPEVREKVSSTMKAYMTAEQRQLRSEKCTAAWTPERRAQQSEALQRHCAEPGVSERRSEAQLEAWKRRKEKR